MKAPSIRKPKGSAVIFLITAISQLSTVFIEFLMTKLFNQAPKMTMLTIVVYIVTGFANLFMCRILFSKRYDNMLLIALAIGFAPYILGLFSASIVSAICEIVFHLVLFTFAYVMIKMPEKPIREKLGKVYFIIPILQIGLLILSTTDIVQRLSENLIASSGAPLNESMSTAVVLIPSLMSITSGILPILCYLWFVKWLVNPYEKK